MCSGFAAGHYVSSFSARNNVSLHAQRTHDVRVITEIRESEPSTAFFLCICTNIGGASAVTVYYIRYVIILYYYLLIC